MCCRGCQAVAQAIVDSGLTDFYRYRTEKSPQARDLVPEQLDELALYDREDLQKSFVTEQSDDSREASLILEGIVCAACVWLNERHVRALPGVQEFAVNYSTHRARVRWDNERIRLSDILEAISCHRVPRPSFRSRTPGADLPRRTPCRDATTGSCRPGHDAGDDAGSRTVRR